MRRLVLPLLACVLLALAWTQQVSIETNLRAQAARIDALSKLPPKKVGFFPKTWIHGADCDNDPPIQVHAYNDDTYILRQSKCETYEAPFMYLLFGEDRALLLDTGANPSTPVQAVVDGVIQDWLAANGRESITLFVAHTHGHFDHIQADAQFEDVSYVQRVVKWQSWEALPFWGFDDYPNDKPVIDLGNRKIDVLGTPGHHPVSMSFYDRDTQLLLTADIVYPGHLFIFTPGDVPIFEESIQRLIDFAATHPVKWVVGCHVETEDEPFSPYAYTTLYQPNEHPLQFKPSILTDVLLAVQSQGGVPACEIFEEIVIHPVYLCGITWNG